jgi:hypothetical protein
MSNEIVMDGDGDDDDTIKRPYIRKLCSDGLHKRRDFFFSYLVFYYYYSLLLVVLELLQWQFIT